MAHEFEIHPAAILPMMTKDELQDLAASIAANGLQCPIMLTHDGKQIVDGRNRLAACKLVNVEPTFDRLAADDDPRDYVISANLMRQHRSKGQSAMRTAILTAMYPETELGERGMSASSLRWLNEARCVLHYSRALAESVVKGITSLDDALITAKEAEQRRLANDAKLERLQNDAPDLMEQVREEKLKIDEAIAVLSAREQDVRDIRDRGLKSADKIVKHFVGCVLCIHQALAQGDPIVVKRELMQQYTEAHLLFMKDQNHD